ncbi:MAG: tetratricopeptide repeat protein [Bryobacteraceae bacterium]
MVLILALFASSLGIASAQTGASHNAEIHDHLQEAIEYLKTHDPNSAIKEFKAALALDPENAEAQGLLGICEKQLGQSSAQHLLESSFPKLTNNNLRIQVGMELADLYYQQGDLERAAAIVHQLMDLNPDNTDILYLAQLVYSELADDTLNKLAIVAPASARMQQVIAEHLVNAGDLKNAIVHYKKCLEINPHMPGVRYELAEATLQSAPSDQAAQSEAKGELEEAIKTEGDSSRIECQLAAIALRESDTERAFSHYQRAFTLNPREVDAQIGMGRMLMSQGHPREALKYLRMAVESDPLNGDAHYRLASVYRSLQMPEEAKKETRLFQEIKETKTQVRELYRQMNKSTKASDDELSTVP